MTKFQYDFDCCFLQEPVSNELLNDFRISPSIFVEGYHVNRNSSLLMPSYTVVDEKKERLLTSFTKIYAFLDFSGVDKASIESLEKAEAMEEYAKVLRTALHLSHSFPKMQVKELVNLICNSWELLCDMSSVIRSSASRKLTNLTTNKKELKTKKTKSISQQDEKKLCEDAESLLLKSSAICIESNMELYRIRALKKLYAENYK